MKDKRIDIKKILSDPVKREKLLKGAVQFIIEIGKL
jgi:hypothetical protein